METGLARWNDSQEAHLHECEHQLQLLAVLALRPPGSWFTQQPTEDFLTFVMDDLWF